MSSMELEVNPQQRPEIVTINGVEVDQDGNSNAYAVSPGEDDIAPDSQVEAGLSEGSDTSGSRSEVQGRLFKSRYIHRWKSPLLMFLFFVIGLAMSFAHCIFYPALEGKIVGGSSSQEERLRFGTAFSFLSQISLSACVWIVYTQWLWKTVHKQNLTLNFLNDAFNVDKSVWSLLNWEMLKEMHTGWSMALFAWCLLLPPFFTPATLFVYPSDNTYDVNVSMPYPAIADANLGHRFAYSPPSGPGTTPHVDDYSRVLTGPRTALNMIFTATSALGEILPITSLYNSLEYSITFPAPIIQCQDANATQISQIDGFLEQEMKKRLGTSELKDSAYFSFVPTYDSNGTLFPATRPRNQTPSNATNELWMAFKRPTSNLNGRGFSLKERLYQVCILRNATYHLHVKKDHGFQNITGSYDVIGDVPFPHDGPGATSNMSLHAYSAFMWVIADQLMGHLSWYQNINQSDPSRAAQFGVIDSQIQQTSLLGSWDLDAFFDFDEEYDMHKVKNMTLSDQRSQDKALAKNRTLDVLIEELSFNTTVGLMHNSLLTKYTNATILRTDDVNRYGYKTYGLFIPYALSNLFTMIVVILGVYSYKHDGVMPDKLFQDIVSAAENPNIVHLLRDRRRGLTVVTENGNPRYMTGPEQTERRAWRLLWKKGGGLRHLWGRVRWWKTKAARGKLGEEQT